jgi:hypothetical protein
MNQSKSLTPTASPNPVVITEERPHHPYSPSSLQSLEACAYFRNRQQKVQHERTVAGERGHRSVETGVDDSRLTDADLLAVAEASDFAAARKAQMQLDADLWAKEQKDKFGLLPKKYPEVEELKELYLPIDDLVFDDAESTTAGYVDLLLLSHDRKYAELIDYKFGYWSVEDAKNNLQALAYILGVFKKFPTVERIKFFFKLPNVDQVTSTEVTREQIPAIYLRIQVVVARAREARRDSTFSKAEPRCPLCCFCDNLGKCPKVEAMMLNVAKKYFALEWPADITPMRVQDPHNTSLALRLAQVAKAWAEAYRSRINERVLSGDAAMPEGYMLERRQGNREVVDIPKFKEVALRFLTPEEYAAICPPPGFGAVEELINIKSPKGTKKTTLKNFGDLLESEKAVARGQPYSFLKIQNDRDKAKEKREGNQSDAE